MIDQIRSQFPLFSTSNPPIFLDTGASSLTPTSVTKAMTDYYNDYSVNIHRGLYEMSQKATELCEVTRTAVADFINADAEEIIFTSGTTLGLNMLASMLKDTVNAGDNIVISIAEHHANILPWKEICDAVGAELRYIGLTDEYRIDYDQAKDLIDDKTKIVSVTGMSNVLGTIPDIKRLTSLAHDHNALMVVDAAQRIAHAQTDVKQLDCDFLVFGAHKMYGPTGVGVLYGKKELLKKMQPVFVGGDIVSMVTKTEVTYVDAPHKFETGTPHIAGIIALGEAVKFITSIGWKYIEQHEKELNDYAIKKLLDIEGLTLIGPKSSNNRGANFAFTIDKLHTHDIADILSKQHIAVRAGSHCAMPLSIELGINGTTRASCGIYTTKKEIDALCVGINKAKQLFSL